jgi:ABC-type transporter MlaC component
VARILTALAIRRPWVPVIGAGLGALLSLWVAATRLELRFGHTDLVSASDRYRELDARDRREFEEVPGRVVVVVRADDPEQARAFAAALAARWADDPKIERVLHRIDLGPLTAKALWYLSPADLAALRERLAEHQERLVSIAGAGSLDDLLGRLNREVTSALVGRVFTGFLDDDPDGPAPPDLTLVLSLLRELNRWLDGARAYRSPWMAALGGTTALPPRDGYLWSDDQRLPFVLADPRRDTTEFNRFAAAVEGIRSDVRDLQRSHPGIEVGLTGRAVIEVDEMAVAQRDMALATLVAVLGVAALFVAFFRGLVRPAFATLTLSLGVCCFRFARGNGRNIMRHDQRGRSTTTPAVGSTVIATLALLGCAALPTPVWAAAPQERVRSLVAAVSQVLEDPALRGAGQKSERRARVATIIRDAFDFESMARDALGPPWTTLTAEQQAEFTRLFGDRFEQSYSLLVLRFLGERTTTYVGESIDGNRATVRTFLVSEKDGALPVDYRLASRDDRWTVVDVVVDGVSLAGNYRAQFGRIIRTSSYEALVGRMRRSVE